MATIEETSRVSPPLPPATPSSQSKPVIVRVKRKANQSRLDAFWLEINERPAKKPLVDFQKLSISQSVDVKVEDLKAKKVFVKHVETVTSTETTMEIVQSFVSNSSNIVESKAEVGEQKLTIKKDSKQEQILSRSIQDREVFASNARFEQIWRSRQGNKEASKEDKELHDMCCFYDVVRVEESSIEMQKHGVTSLEDQKILCSYLPLLREFLPSAVAEVESDIQSYLSSQEVEDYVYDYYAVKDDMDIDVKDAAGLFPLVQVEDEDFYDGPDDESEYDTDDSNAEDHPRNDYPDEETSESESEVSHNESEVEEGEGEGEGEEEEVDEEESNAAGHDLMDDQSYDGYSDDGDYFDVDGDDFCWDDGSDEDWR